MCVGKSIQCYSVDLDREIRTGEQLAGQYHGQFGPYVALPNLVASKFKPARPWSTERGPDATGQSTCNGWVGGNCPEATSQND